MGGNALRSKSSLNEFPGPGTYNSMHTQTKPKSRLSSMGAKPKAKKFKNGVKVPSPVAYDPTSAFNHLKRKYTGAHNVTGIGFAKGGRTKTR